MDEIVRKSLRPHKRTDPSITTNYNPVKLTWEDEVFDEIPILRDNWMEVNRNYQVYFAECVMSERTGRTERMGKWARNIFTNL